LLLTLAFFSVQIDHAQAANDHRIGCARFFYEQDLANCKGEERTGVLGTQQVAQASSRTGGYDRFPGGGSPGGVPSPGHLYYRQYQRGETYSSGGSRGGTPPAGSIPGGSFPGGSIPGGSHSGGLTSAGSGQ